MSYSLFGKVPDNWTVCKIGDVVSLRQGLQISSKLRIPNFEEGYIPLLKITDLPNQHFSEYVTNIEKQYIASKDDIIYTRTGQVGLVYTDIEGCVHNNCFKVEYDKNQLDKKYLYYYINNKYFKEIANNVASGSVQKDLTHSAFKILPFAFPKLPIQKKLADILSLLENKINLNKESINTIEELAQTLFKHWFIDFEFPNEEGQPYKSSSGKMMDSELGELPEGFTIDVMSSLISETIGGDWGKDSLQGNYICKVSILRGADIPEVRLGKAGKVPSRFILEKNYRNKKLLSGDIIIEISGGSPTQSTGRVSYINQEILSRYDNMLLCTNFCRAMRPKTHQTGLFIYMYFNYLYNEGLFFSYENGTTGIKNLDLNSFLQVYQVPMPPSELMIKFNKVIEKYYSYIQELGNENIKLEELRDSLLPKLLSGKIEIPDESVVN